MDLFVLVGVVAVVVVGLSVHEAAHAAVADWLGDPTARQLGRVTLNPLAHIDPFMTLLLPAMLFTLGLPVFGGAKPVPVNLANFRRPLRDHAMVAFAGPASNLLQAVFWAGLLSVLLHLGTWNGESRGVEVLRWAVLANAGLFMLNMLPLPPLDGSRIVAAFLSPPARQAYVALEPIGLFLLLGLFYLADSFNYWFWGMVTGLANGIGELVQLGPVWAA